MSDSTDPLDAYKAVRRCFDDAVAHVHALVSGLRASAPPQVADKLNDWRSLLIGNMQSPRVPQGGPGIRDWKHIDDDECPGLAPLKEALLRWRDAQFRLAEAWQSLPPDRKTTELPPY
jgi:hypothetical protein